MSRVAGYHCATCHGERLHTISIVEHPSGKVTRTRCCSACSTSTDLTYKEQPGITCPVCSNIRLMVRYTRHRMGSTFRVKMCLFCHHRVRTVERYEMLGKVAYKT